MIHHMKRTFDVGEYALFQSLPVRVVSADGDLRIIKRLDGKSFGHLNHMPMDIIAINICHLEEDKKQVTFEMTEAEAAKVYALLNHVGLGNLVELPPTDGTPFRDAIRKVFPHISNAQYRHWNNIAKVFNERTT